MSNIKLCNRQYNIKTKLFILLVCPSHNFFILYHYKQLSKKFLILNYNRKRTQIQYYLPYTWAYKIIPTYYSNNMSSIYVYSKLSNIVTMFQYSLGMNLDYTTTLLLFCTILFTCHYIVLYRI